MGHMQFNASSLLRYPGQRTVAVCRGFVRSDDGAAYSVGLALTLPLYALLIAVLVECALLLNVQSGVDYAAWCAARAAVVWLPAEVTALSTAEQNEDMVRRAAVNAISAWSSANASARPAGDPRGAAAVLQGYRSFARGKQQTADYVVRKWNYANAATRVVFEPSLDQLKSNRQSLQVVRVTVHYEMPFQLPAVGLLLGRRGQSGWVRDLQSTVELTLERPRTDNGSMGIGYSSRPVR
jgi:Flp pilus assembly protein TadG